MLIERKILADEHHIKYKSLDFNFDPKQLLQIERNLKPTNTRNSSSKIEISKYQLPKVKLQLENKIH